MIKASPITAHKIDFIRTVVEVNGKAEPETVANYTFSGAKIGWAFHSSQNDDGGTWIGVGFSAGQDPEEIPACPYMIDIQAVGLFSVHESFPEDKEKYVFECGAALVYGAIREMVANITSRSAFGRLMLPTPSFQGLYEQQNAKQQED